jgi:hypothetical protein
MVNQDIYKEIHSTIKNKNLKNKKRRKNNSK